MGGYKVDCAECVFTIIFLEIPYAVCFETGCQIFVLLETH